MPIAKTSHRAKSIPVTSSPRLRGTASPSQSFVNAAERRFQKARLLEADGDLSAAEAIYRELIVTFERRSLNPATCLAALGHLQFIQHKLTDATASFERALTYQSKLYEADSNLALISKELADWKKTELHALRALEARPDGFEAHFALGWARINLHKNGPAIQSFLTALTLKPDYWAALAGLAIAYVHLGDIEVARGLYRRAFELGPSSPSSHSGLLFALHYDPGISSQELLKEHREFGNIVAPKALSHSFLNSRSQDRRLRIGHLSSDFRSHVVSFFIEGVLKCHDRENVEIFCYYNNPKRDVTTARIESLSNRFVTIHSASDDEAAALIRDDMVDILVDLNGHTSGNRLPILARRPAPIQASWCGYFDTTGLDAVDYLIVDRIIAPEEERPSWTEQPMRLPESYVCFTPAKAPDVGPLPADRNREIRFGCFNNPSKVNRKLANIWAAVLDEVADSKLILRHFSLGDPLTKERITRLFRENGIDSSRFELLDGGGNYETLQMYNQVDIAFDCLPYNGGTTTCEALWMGVPVVTLYGDRFVSRVGSSLLTFSGLPGCVATSPLEYVKCAKRLAEDREQLAKLRSSLRGHLAETPVFNPNRFTKGLENAYRTAFQRWCQQR
jgi:protein O-GlcNAc transferase